jgi:hypothetical protein
VSRLTVFAWLVCEQQEEGAVKKLTVNYDAIALVAIALVVSLGMNVWQRQQFNDLLAEYVDSQWEAQNVKANMVYARTLLKECDPVKYADLDVNE